MYGIVVVFAYIHVAIGHTDFIETVFAQFQNLLKETSKVMYTKRVCVCGGGEVEGEHFSMRLIHVLCSITLHFAKIYLTKNI